MTERRRDPLELWVGTWTPEEWIARENRRRDDTLKLAAPEQDEQKPTTSD